MLVCLPFCNIIIADESAHTALEELMMPAYYCFHLKAVTITYVSFSAIFIPLHSSTNKKHYKKDLAINPVTTENLDNPCHKCREAIM